jgi:hypothetical protein
MVRFVEQGLLAGLKGSGALNFKAPETNEAITSWKEKMDVFSYGLILTEILTESDFFSRRAMIMVSSKAATEFRPQWKGEQGEKVKEVRLRKLLESCWKMRPEERPSFAGILDEFDAINFQFWGDVDAQEVREFLATLKEK